MRKTTLATIGLFTALYSSAVGSVELLVTCKDGNKQFMGIVSTGYDGYQDLFGEHVKIRLSNNYLIGDIKTSSGDQRFYISLKTNAFSQKNGEIDPYKICGVKKLGINQTPSGDPDIFKFDRNDPQWW